MRWACGHLESSGTIEFASICSRPDLFEPLKSIMKRRRKELSTFEMILLEQCLTSKKEDPALYSEEP